jgi:hypothetical protein
MFAVTELVRTRRSLYLEYRILQSPQICIAISAPISKIGDIASQALPYQGILEREVRRAGIAVIVLSGVSA